MGFKTILVANRGEIAVRVMRSARAAGYGTVAVYSEADADELHVRTADQSVCIGPAAAAESYLVIDNIIEAARQTGADAIHPGYGFLAENAEFARACADAGITFIGPPPEAIELMGDKRGAKIAMIKAGVPCVPGYEGEDQSDATLVAEAKKIGLPVMVKASAGGGGRGMRLVANEDDLEQAIKSARTEARNAFGSDLLILEKAVQNPRHVEIQVFADTLGNAIHLGERDCSVQRRHQKIIEESPSPVVDEELRGKMGGAAVEAARACGYVGAGTVEFLVDDDGNFYFLEMNTRLQVEHPVTEMVTGQDLVDWQIRVARGEPLPLAQDDVRLDGHAVEVRLYAEDPARGFMPQAGRVLAWAPAADMPLRVDHCVIQGNVVSPHYDPMVAKLITWGPSRREALRLMATALRRSTFLGLRSNKAFLAHVCDHPEFIENGATTAFIDEHIDPSWTELNTPDSATWALAALIHYLDSGLGTTDDPRWVGWRSASQIDSILTLQEADVTVRARIRATGPGSVGQTWTVTLDDSGEIPAACDGEDIESWVFDVVSCGGGRIEYAQDGPVQQMAWALDDHNLYLDTDRASFIVRNATADPPADAGGAGSGLLAAPLDGAVISVNAAAGDTVEVGQIILIVEAMKMEHQIKADVDGTIKTINVDVGDQVKTKQLLAEIEPADGGE